MKRELTVNDIRKALDHMRRAESLRKTVKHYHMEVKNFKMFNAMRRLGKIKQTKAGCWDIVEKESASRRDDGQPKAEAPR